MGNTTSYGPYTESLHRNEYGCRIRKTKKVSDVCIFVLSSVGDLGSRRVLNNVRNRDSHSLELMRRYGELDRSSQFWQLKRKALAINPLEYTWSSTTLVYPSAWYMNTCNEDAILTGTLQYHSGSPLSRQAIMYLESYSLRRSADISSNQALTDTKHIDLFLSAPFSAPTRETYGTAPA